MSGKQHVLEILQFHDRSESSGSTNPTGTARAVPDLQEAVVPETRVVAGISRSRRPGNSISRNTPVTEEHQVDGSQWLHTYGNQLIKTNGK